MIQPILRFVMSPVARGMLNAGVLSRFRPSALFRAGEQGVWYDPSDLSTLYQDSAGTTPVTASGQPVGLMLDKSKGLVRGGEAVANGDFSSGLTGWVQSTAGYWSVVGGRAYHAPTGEYRDIRQSLSTLAGKWVEITYDIEVLQGSTVSGVAGTTAILGVGAHSVRLFALLPASPVFFASRQAIGVATEIYIDNISVRELLGVHGVQATAGMRPLYQSPPSRVVYDQVDDKIVATFASSLGSNVTIARAIPGVGAQILTGQTVGTSYTDNVNSAALIIVDRTLTGAETSALTAYLNNKAGL